MYSTGIKLNNYRSACLSLKLEKLIKTVSETLNATLSGRLIVSPLTWICGLPPVGMGNEKQIWRRVLPSRSPLGRLNDCETSSRQPSPWIYCENPAQTLPLNDSWSGTCAQQNGRGICENGSEISISGTENGICDYGTWIYSLQTFFQILNGNGGVSCCYGNETCEEYIKCFTIHSAILLST